MENLPKDHRTFKVIKLLGGGAFGKAYLVKNYKDENVVIKQVDLEMMSEEEQKLSKQEAKILEKFDHPNIVKIMDCFIKNNKLYIVMDYCDDGDLKGKISNQKGKYFSEDEIIDLFTQICLAIKHIHDRKILHRDLKTQNIFLMKEGGIAKIGDFGVSKCLNATLDKAKTFTGTPYYLSPEIIENTPYSYKSDIWSLGIILYELCALRVPFEADNLPQLYMKISKGIYKPIPNIYSQELRDLVGLLLNVDSNKRPGVSQILKMNIIKNRINKFLKEAEFDSEFSHTIIHNYKPKFEDKKKASELIKGKEKLEKVEIKEKKDSVGQIKKIIPPANLDRKHYNLSPQIQRENKLIEPVQKNRQEHKNYPSAQKISIKEKPIEDDITEEKEKISKMANLLKYINKKSNHTPDNNAYNVNKMLILMNKVAKDDFNESDSETNVDTAQNQNVDEIKEEPFETNLEKESFDKLKIDNNSGFAEIQAKLGDKVFEVMFKIIKFHITKLTYDKKNVTLEIIQSLTKLKIDRVTINLAVEKVTEIYSKLNK